MDNYTLSQLILDLAVIWFGTVVGILVLYLVEETLCQTDKEVLQD